jgi:hypothetical protein
VFRELLKWLYFRWLPARLPAAAATAAATAAAAGPAIATAAATTGPSVRLRPRLVDVQRSAFVVLAIQAGDGLLGFLVAAHLDKPKAPRLTGIAIRHNADALNGPVSLKQGAKTIFRRPVTEVSYKNILHPSVSLTDLKAASFWDRRTSRTSPTFTLAGSLKSF